MENNHKIYDVSVIMLNYNSASYSIACIKSILEKVHKNLNYNIVVVDNNSQDNDFDALQAFCASQKDAPLKIIRSILNVGFSAANMIGVQNTNARYLFFLNNDTTLLNDCLSILFDFSEKHEDMAVCTPQTFNENGELEPSFGYIPTLGVKFLGHGFARLFAPEQYPKRHRVYTEPIGVPLVTGAAMFVKSAIFAKMGGFDTNLFLYCEEEDFATRLKMKDYKAYLVPTAHFVHYAGKSTKRNLHIEKEYYISLFYFLRKHNNALCCFLWKLLLFFKVFKKAYKSLDALKLSWFILQGAPMKYSLRFKQEINFHH
jgi:GT2 family glycosyltransferase